MPRHMKTTVLSFKLPLRGLKNAEGGKQESSRAKTARRAVPSQKPAVKLKVMSSRKSKKANIIPPSPSVRSTTTSRSHIKDDFFFDPSSKRRKPKLPLSARGSVKSTRTSPNPRTKRRSTSERNCVGSHVKTVSSARKWKKDDDRNRESLSLPEAWGVGGYYDSHHFGNNKLNKNSSGSSTSGRMTCGEKANNRYRSPGLRVEIKLAEQLQQINNSLNSHKEKDRQRFEIFRSAFKDIIKTDTHFSRVLELIYLAYDEKIEGADNSNSVPNSKEYLELREELNVLKEENADLRSELSRRPSIDEYHRKSSLADQMAEELNKNKKADDKLIGNQELQNARREIKKLSFQMLKLRTEADLARSREIQATKTVEELAAKLEMQHLVLEGKKRAPPKAWDRSISVDPANPIFRSNGGLCSYNPLSGGINPNSDHIPAPARDKPGSMWRSTSMVPMRDIGLVTEF
ncbi:hypothetical protein AAMO2058_001039000 [Amorphochlora amoebiformis]